MRLAPSLILTALAIHPALTAATYQGPALKALTEDPVSPGAPVYVHLPAPSEGNYRVTVTLGSSEHPSDTTVKAELRRLMVENVHTAAGQFETRTFLVNIRTPKISTGGEVKLKPRDKTSEALAWDDKLTLEFIGTNPSVQSIQIERADDAPTLYIAGDSTSTDQPVEPFNSWGQMLTRFVKPTISVANHGESGESLKSFLGEGRWAKLLSVLRPGDFVLIQMGHNDQKEKGEGVGAFTNYKADLKRFIADTRAKGAEPILVTPMNRLTFSEAGKITNSLGDYPEAVRQTGREEKTPVIDLNAMSVPLYEFLGPTDAHLLFAGKDTTHHSDYGSYQFAKCVAESFRRLDLPLAKHIADQLPRYDPAHPDAFASFQVPAEPPTTAPKPYGN